MTRIVSTAYRDPAPCPKPQVTAPFLPSNLSFPGPVGCSEATVCWATGAGPVGVRMHRL